MANVADGNDDTAIWGGERSSRITRRRLIGTGALIGGAALAVGLVFGLKDSSAAEDYNKNIISGQAVDPNAVGCFADEGDARVLEAQYTDNGMTPAVRATIDRHRLTRA